MKTTGKTFPAAPIPSDNHSDRILKKENWQKIGCLLGKIQFIREQRSRWGYGNKDRGGVTLSTDSENNFILKVFLIGICPDGLWECSHWSFLSHSHVVETLAVVLGQGRRGGGGEGGWWWWWRWRKCLIALPLIQSLISLFLSVTVNALERSIFSLSLSVKMHMLGGMRTHVCINICQREYVCLKGSVS